MTPDAYVDQLARARALLGELAALAEVRQMDRAALGALVARTEGLYTSLGDRALDFIGAAGALDGPLAALSRADDEGRRASTAAAVGTQVQEVERVAAKVELLIEVVGGLELTDATQRTAVLARLGDLLARRNGVRAALETRAAELRAVEAEADFAAVIGVIGQRLQAALLSATDTAACDARLTDCSPISRTPISASATCRRSRR